jgi:hypothetical protein
VLDAVGAPLVTRGLSTRKECRLSTKDVVGPHQASGDWRPIVAVRQRASPAFSGPLDLVKPTAARLCLRLDPDQALGRQERRAFYPHCFSRCRDPLEGSLPLSTPCRIAGCGALCRLVGVAATPRASSRYSARIPPRERLRSAQLCRSRARCRSERRLHLSSPHDDSRSPPARVRSSQRWHHDPRDDSRARSQAQ